MALRGEFRDIPAGTRFGRLVVLAPAEPFVNQDGRRRGTSLCRCDCGAEVVVQNGNLKAATRSCGCGARANKKGKPGRRKSEGRNAETIIYSAYRTAAKARGLSFDLTRERLLHMSKQECLYCGAPPQNRAKPRTKDAAWNDAGTRFYQGIDRLHNHLGYSAANCVPACSNCNTRLRQDVPLDVWMYWVRTRHPARYPIVLATVVAQLGPNWEQDVKDERDIEVLSCRPNSPSGAAGLIAGIGKEVV